MKPTSSVTRRSFLAGAAITAGGLSGPLASEERYLLAAAEQRVGGQAHAAAANKPDSPMPMGRIGRLSLSRLLCGGNLFSGFAHSRELIYVSAVMKQYFTTEKILDTLELCAAQGINTAVMRCDEHIIAVLEAYRRQRRPAIQWIAQTYPSLEKPYENIQKAIDCGAVGAYMQGAIGDKLVAEGRLDLLGKVLEFIKRNGLVAGVGAHLLETIRAVEKEKFPADFYFKTINSAAYHSERPEQIAQVMQATEKPWIAFKVLGAGVVKPHDGFRLAFSSGADFIAVGMFDFQVGEDAAIVRQLLGSNLQRQRPWRA